MVRHARTMLLAASLAAAAWGSPALRAQELPPAPVPVTSPSTVAAGPQTPPPVLTPPPPGPMPTLLPPPPLTPPAFAPYQDNNGPLLVNDPLLDRPTAPPPGWFTAVELSILGPHIKNRLQATVQIDGFQPNLVRLPTAELDWTGSPHIELGYRLPEGFGEFVASYRVLATEGTAILPGFDLDGGDMGLKSRLIYHVIDLDYSSREFSLDPHWDMKWRIGGRIATNFYDSLAEGNFLEQRVSNHFVGGGPHVGLDLWRRFDTPGWGLFLRLDGATVIGRMHQSFEETAFVDLTPNSGLGIPDAFGLVGATSDLHKTEVVPMLRFQAGLSWSPEWRGRWLRYAFGYEIEQWWYLGQVGDSRAELTTQGVFFRAEFSY